MAVFLPGCGEFILKGPCYLCNYCLRNAASQRLGHSCSLSRAQPFTAFESTLWGSHRPSLHGHLQSHHLTKYASPPSSSRTHHLNSRLRGGALLKCIFYSLRLSHLCAMSFGDTNGETGVSGSVARFTASFHPRPVAPQSGCLHQRVDALFHLGQSLQGLLDLNLIKLQTQKFRLLSTFPKL